MVNRMSINVHSGKFFQVIPKYRSSNNRQPMREPGFDFKTPVFEVVSRATGRPVLLGAESKLAGARTGKNGRHRLAGLHAPIGVRAAGCPHPQPPIEYRCSMPNKMEKFLYKGRNLANVDEYGHQITTTEPY